MQVYNRDMNREIVPGRQESAVLRPGARIKLENFVWLSSKPEKNGPWARLEEGQRALVRVLCEQTDARGTRTLVSITRSAFFPRRGQSSDARLVAEVHREGGQLFALLGWRREESGVYVKDEDIKGMVPLADFVKRIRQECATFTSFAPGAGDIYLEVMTGPSANRTR